MSHYQAETLTRDRAELLTRLPGVPGTVEPRTGEPRTGEEGRPAVQVRTAAPGGVERRRPGRLENASPELIALMRKPNRAARLRVALYDAPGFVLPQDTRRPRMEGRGALRMALALVACSGACTAAFEGMLFLWG